MEKQFYDLNASDVDDLDRHRRWMKGHYIQDAEQNYNDCGKKLDLIVMILDNNWIEPNETWKLQSLGVALGDALAQRLGLVWMIINDEYGRSPTLKDPRSTINVNALTIIRKRIERGEKIDVVSMFTSICNEVIQMRTIMP